MHTLLTRQFLIQFLPYQLFLLSKKFGLEKKILFFLFIISFNFNVSYVWDTIYRSPSPFLFYLCLCLAIKFDELKYWLIIPILLFLGFFTKTNTSCLYCNIDILISILYLFLNFNKKIIYYVIISSVIILLIFILLLFYFEIPLNLVLIQYFLFPMSLGETRLEWLFPLEFKRFVLRHKLLYFALAIPIFYLLKNILKNYKSVLSKEKIISLFFQR